MRCRVNVLVQQPSDDKLEEAFKAQQVGGGAGAKRGGQRVRQQVGGGAGARGGKRGVQQVAVGRGQPLGLIFGGAGGCLGGGEAAAPGLKRGGWGCMQKGAGGRGRQAAGTWCPT